MAIVRQAVMASLIILAQPPLARAASPQASAPQTSTQQADQQQTTVEGVLVKPEARIKSAPAWSEKIRYDGWPYLAAGEDGSVLMFAKTAKGNDGLSPQGKVWVRREFRSPRTEPEAPGALPYLSEKVLIDIDCGQSQYKNLAAFRYPKHNLQGAEDAYRYEQSWQAAESGTLDATVLDAACMKP